MGEITTGFRRVLSTPTVYTAFQNLMGARQGWVDFVGEFVRPVPGMKLLDLGCGPGDLLDHLPVTVDYWGVDISETYIRHAQVKFGKRGNFACKLLTHEDLARLPRFDVVVASGVLHHMEDNMAKAYVRLAYAALRSRGGRLVTIDPCWAPNQNPVARFLISRDRGQNVRDAEAYEHLAASSFSTRKITVRHKAWIPYTHCFMECVRE